MLSQTREDFPLQICIFLFDKNNNEECHLQPNQWSWIDDEAPFPRYQNFLNIRAKYYWLRSCNMVLFGNIKFNIAHLRKRERTGRVQRKRERARRALRATCTHLQIGRPRAHTIAGFAYIYRYSSGVRCVSVHTHARTLVYTKRAAL